VTLDKACSSYPCWGELCTENLELPAPFPYTNPKPVSRGGGQVYSGGTRLYLPSGLAGDRINWPPPSCYPTRSTTWHKTR